MTLIELDESAQDRPESGAALWHRRRRLIFVVGLLAVGGVIGGVATYQWEMRRVGRVEESTVAVLAVPGALSWTGEATTSFPSVGDSETVVKMTGQVGVVNAGPMQIYLRTLTVDQQGFTLRGADVERWIGPRDASVVEVFAEMTCSSDVLRAPKISISVETADRQVRPSSVELDGRTWDRELERACSER